MDDLRELESLMVKIMSIENLVYEYKGVCWAALMECQDRAAVRALSGEGERQNEHDKTST